MPRSISNGWRIIAGPHSAQRFRRSPRRSPSRMRSQSTCSRALQQPRVLLEDQSRTIGRLALPENLHAMMQAAPLVVLDVSRDERARRIYDEYVDGPLLRGVPSAQLHARFTDAGGSDPPPPWRQSPCSGAQRRSTRRSQRIESEPDAHLAWIERLLEWYYDPPLRPPARVQAQSWRDPRRSSAPARDYPALSVGAEASPVRDAVVVGSWSWSCSGVMIVPVRPRRERLDPAREFARCDQSSVDEQRFERAQEMLVVLVMRSRRARASLSTLRSNHAISSIKRARNSSHS